MELDWSQYPTLYPFYQRLPKGGGGGGGAGGGGEERNRPFGQCLEYPVIGRPVREVQRLRLEFAGGGGGPSFFPGTGGGGQPPPPPPRTPSPWVHTGSLWSCITSLFDETHGLGGRSFQQCHTTYVIQSLRAFLMEGAMLKFLGGRRAYPLLELLDKPRVAYERKHQVALGFFLSFLFHQKVQLDGEEFQWSRNCEGPPPLQLHRNPRGFWSLGASGERRERERGVGRKE